MSKFLVDSSNAIFQALHDAGLIVGDPDNIQRVVIDLQVGHAARIYVANFGDDETLTPEVLVAGLTVETA